MTKKEKKCSVALTEDMQRQLRVKAAQENMSMGQYVRHLIAEAIKGATQETPQEGGQAPHFSTIETMVRGQVC